MCRRFGNSGWTWRVVLKQPQLQQGPNPLSSAPARLCPGQGELQGVMPSSGPTFGQGEGEQRYHGRVRKRRHLSGRAVEAAGDEGIIRGDVLGSPNAHFTPCFSIPGAEQEPGTHSTTPHCPEGSAPDGEATKAGGNPWQLRRGCRKLPFQGDWQLEDLHLQKDQKHV